MIAFDRHPSTADAAASLEQGIEDLRAGKLVVLIGAAARRSEGTLTIAADHCTADAVAYMARHGMGIISLALTEERCEELGLQPMTSTNTSSYQAAFTVSIEARKGITTGISAADRARTIAVAIDPASRPNDLASPGHVFPLRARDGGVLVRVSHTEGAVDLARLAGLTPAAVLCGILTADGRMAGPTELHELAQQLDLAVVYVEDIVAYRRDREIWLEPAGTRELVTAGGTFTATSFVEKHTGLTHLALTKGDKPWTGPAFVHEECPSGDIFGTLDCACGAALREALETIERGGSGVLVYVARDASGGRLQDVIAPSCREPSAQPLRKESALARQILRAIEGGACSPPSQS
jgi:3,4-dihydroxy 2-butanone 4-phosphate synthase/GTP cyclohydrolase II